MKYPPECTVERRRGGGRLHRSAQSKTTTNTGRASLIYVGWRPEQWGNKVIK